MTHQIVSDFVKTEIGLLMHTYCAMHRLTEQPHRSIHDNSDCRYGNILLYKQVSHNVFAGCIDPT